MIPQHTRVCRSKYPAAIDHHQQRLELLDIDLDRDSMKTVYEKFGLENGTQDFIGHAMALYLDDE
jgi:RAB protein geranylgeranyltransferase component A